MPTTFVQQHQALSVRVDSGPEQWATHIVQSHLEHIYETRVVSAYCAPIFTHRQPLQ